MRAVKFGIIFAAVIALPLGVLTRHPYGALASGFVVGCLVYLILRFVSMPFRH